MVVVVMGAAGAGKTTVGRALAEAVGWPFLDADAVHSGDAIAKMRAGIALTDADRAPWLAALHGAIARALDRREHLVLACSALHQRYRDVLRGGLRPVRFVFLKAGEATLRARLAARAGHYAGPALVASQLAAIDEPLDALTLDATRPVAALVSATVYEFGL